MVLGAALMTPLGIASAGGAVFDPSLLGVGLAVGTLASVVPYSLELAALRRLSTATFGILMSLEPAAGRGRRRRLPLPAALRVRVPGRRARRRGVDRRQLPGARGDAAARLISPPLGREPHSHGVPVDHAQVEALLDRGEEQGCLHISELHELVQLLELDDDGIEDLYDRIEARGIEVTDDCARDDAVDASYVNGELAVATTDALQLFLNEVGRYPLLTAAGGGRAREADRARRPGGEGADDQLEPPARGLDRQEATRATASRCST